ncbi:HD-GYP domain-containing protein [Pseudohalioglobus sediminis]|uniref:HD-GYP domain-containing protein n=1 Tax=Pseudohalioglobus sediminis TaxID=2606449 RepID=A0A5B0X4X3_9GAMM|nr:HD-GYP domain-containing protein [Pseudohalioglobus sediminis]KAA1194282.1 HD-GYP domain-containing protein [Pseudohalioglobus sediminis]
MLQTVKVPTTDLTKGMFVSGLDRDWLGTPFLTQGFLLQSDSDIERVRDYCEYVWVDIHKCVYVSAKLQRRAQGERPRVPLPEIFKGRTLQVYSDQAEWKEEHPRATRALNSLLHDITDIFDKAAESGKLDAIRLKTAADPIVGSISRNPDACLWLGRLKQHDEYSYQHSLSVAIWAVALGRQIGLHKRDLRSLATGAMLMDVGKLLVDPELLRANRALTEEETREMRHHVAHGVHLVKKSGIINQDILDMVGFHHERHDGSGYPRGLKGDQIPPFARIAGIVDTYDAVTSNRSYATARAPADAIKVLYEQRDKHFQAELVEAFIQAIGIYPAGTIVELTSGEVGIVVAESRKRRLLPKVILVLDRKKKPYPRPKIVDLQDTQTPYQDKPISIARSLEPGAHDIDIARYQF